MITTTLNRSQVVDALYDAGLDEDALRADYSGRGMYGERCFGIVGSESDMLRFVLALSHRLEDRGEEWLPNVCSDNMGLSIIWYWPTVQVPEEDEEEPSYPVTDGARAFQQGDNFTVASETAPCEVCGDAVLAGLRYMAGPLGGRIFCEEHDPGQASDAVLEHDPDAGRKVEDPDRGGPRANVDRWHRFHVGDQFSLLGVEDVYRIEARTWRERDGKLYPTYTTSGWAPYQGGREYVEDVLDTDDLLPVGKEVS